jgi:large subunit ribosomal protein L32
MGVPADKTTKSKRNMRRSHLALSKPGMSNCPQCQELKMPHRVCPACGHYGKKGESREVLAPKS